MKILELQDLSSKMIIMVPPSTSHLEVLKLLLKLRGFDRLKKTSESRQLKVTLPKFSIECEINLKDTLISVSSR